MNKIIPTAFYSIFSAIGICSAQNTPEILQSPGQTNTSATITSEFEAAKTNNLPAIDKVADEKSVSQRKETTIEDNAYHEMTVLTEALMIIRRHYVRELSYNEIIDGALDGMLQSLDPHSCFMRRDEYNDFMDDSEGEFCGLGITVGIHEGLLTVLAPIDNTPAAKAGIIAGDKILKINGSETFGMDLSSASEMLRGQAGTSVTLTIVRGNELPFDLKIKREKIDVPAVKGMRFIRPGIGYIRITQFSDQVAPTFANDIGKLDNEGIAGLILDLRENPGGLLSMAVYVSEQFLERGKTIVSIKERSDVGDGRQIKSSCKRPRTNFALAVLIDKESASAAEIVAGAMQDNRRAVIIGETSYGKASVQTVIPLESEPGCALKLTTAYYYTPAEKLIHGKGITPDIEVEMSEKDKIAFQMQSYGKTSEEYTDSAIERAADALTAIISVSRQNK